MYRDILVYRVPHRPGLISEPTPGEARGELLDGETMTKLVESMIGIQSLSKAEIEKIMQGLIMIALDYVNSSDLFIYLKQVEYGVKFAMNDLKERAFDALGYQLGGATSGLVLGVEVSISYPNEWHYGSLVADLKERQKEELRELQEYEKAHGIAHQVPGKGRITITLRDKSDDGP
jgi:hypothetical protein